MEQEGSRVYEYILDDIYEPPRYNWWTRLNLKKKDTFRDSKPGSRYRNGDQHTLCRKSPTRPEAEHVPQNTKKGLLVSILVFIKTRP